MPAVIPKLVSSFILQCDAQGSQFCCINILAKYPLWQAKMALCTSKRVHSTYTVKSVKLRWQYLKTYIHKYIVIRDVSACPS